MSNDNIELKKAELEKSLKTNVYPVVFVDEEHKKTYTGFFSEPKLAAKMAAFDIVTLKQSLTEAGKMILDCSVIKESSDPEIYTEGLNDKVYLGACVAAADHVKFLMNTYKKK